MLLHNVEFDFKATRGADYKRYTHGRKEALAAIAALDADSEDYILDLCDIMDDFFCSLLGEDYADRLGIDTEDVEPLLGLLTDFNTAAQPPALKDIAAAMPEVPEPAKPEKVASSIPPNRAQRRAARRKAHRNAAPAAPKATAPDAQGKVYDALRALQDDPEAMRQIAAIAAQHYAAFPHA